MEFDSDRSLSNVYSESNLKTEIENIANSPNHIRGANLVETQQYKAFEVMLNANIIL